MRRLLSAAFLIATLILPTAHRPASAPVQEADLDQQVEALMAQMSPEARVGQLFVITFFGQDVSPDSDIARLIRDYQVGGVVLLRGNDNFSDQGSLPQQVYGLTADLQTLASQSVEGPATGGDDDEIESLRLTPAPASPYIPLFIGMEHEGSNAAYLQLNSGVTPLPSNMALGATWDPAYAEQVGTIVGQELSAMGVNLLLGPDVDVVEIPQPLASGELGTRVFGGEPYWVAQMSAAYVSGAHVGSQGRLAVVPRHFPGYGGADRLASVEIPTVRRTRDQLIQVDLKPFFAVTGEAATPEAMADGVLVGHIRYQGFHADSVRVATRPISSDPVALQSLLSIDAIASWRDEGGLLISDALGLRGVRRIYDPQETLFPGRSIVRDAFGAGNDVLYLGNFGSNPRVNQTAAVTDVIDFFLQRYETDPAFQAQVDASVRRILRKKLSLYGEFTLETVIPDSVELDAVGTQEEVTFDAARAALTLLEPSQADLLAAPERDEKMLILTDTRTTQQCSDCEEVPLVDVDALRSEILQLYGPTATGLASLADISVFSLDELDQYLEFGPQETAAEGEAPEPDALGIALDSADWVVILMMDPGDGVAGTQVVKRFLAEPAVNPDARIVVFAMGAPYYLDSTEVSKLTAYYALYGYEEPFINVAARALYQEIAPIGASPVSVAAIDYDIQTATSSDPSQVIELTYSVVENESLGTATPGEERAPELGDTLLLTTDVIVDYNGRPVPDGTPVEFLQNYVNEGVRTRQTVTTGGIAQAQILVEGPGELRISATSGDAQNSETVQLIISDTGTEIDVLPADVTPTQNPTLAPTQTPVTPTETAPPPVEPEQTIEPAIPQENVDFSDLMIALLGLAAIGAVVFIYGQMTRDLNYALLLLLPTLLFGLIGYNYYALLLPGALAWRDMFVGLGAGMAAWISALIGLGIVVGGIQVWNRWIVVELRKRQRR